MGHTSVVKELLSSGADVDAIREVKKKSPDFLYMPPFVSNETWSDCLGFILLKIFNSMSLECLTTCNGFKTIMILCLSYM